MQKQVFYAIIVVVIIIAAASVYALYFMPPSTTTTTSTTTSTTTTTTPSIVINLIAENIKFNTTNPTINVKVGQTVNFVIINKDTVSHEFTIKDIPGAATNILSPGQQQTITVTFNTAGTYGYYCSVHPGLMDGQIVVQG